MRPRLHARRDLPRWCGLRSLVHLSADDRGHRLLHSARCLRSTVHQQHPMPDRQSLRPKLLRRRPRKFLSVPLLLPVVGGLGGHHRYSPVAILSTSSGSSVTTQSASSAIANATTRAPACTVSTTAPVTGSSRTTRSSSGS